MEKESYACEKCKKVRTLEEGAFMDETQKTFCCKECCKDEEKENMVCEFC